MVTRFPGLALTSSMTFGLNAAVAFAISFQTDSIDPSVSATMCCAIFLSYWQHE